MGLYILYGVASALACFVIYMLVVTAAMGTNRLKVAQFLMSSMIYNEEADTKINLLIDKLEAGLLTVDRLEKSLSFNDKETGKKAGEIWTGNKYYAYANLAKYGANNSNEWSCFKPKIKTFKRVVKLEQSLETTSTDVTAATTAPAKRKETEEVVLD
jgi:hypothetical protein